MEITREPIIEPEAQPTEPVHSPPAWRRLLRSWYLWSCFLPIILLIYFVCMGERPLTELWSIQRRGEVLQEQLDSLQRFEAQYQSRIQQLQTAEGVERIARERYLMKAQGEEVFVIKAQQPSETED